MQTEKPLTVEELRKFGDRLEEERKTLRLYHRKSTTRFQKILALATKHKIPIPHEILEIMKEGNRSDRRKAESRLKKYVDKMISLGRVQPIAHDENPPTDNANSESIE